MEFNVATGIFHPFLATNVIIGDNVSSPLLSLTGTPSIQRLHTNRGDICDMRFEVSLT